MVVSPNIVAPQAKHRGHKHPLDSTVCTKTPVMNLQVTPASLTIAPNGSASFTACTQYATTYSLKVAPKGFVSVPASVTPTTQPTTIKAATISVTAGSTCGSGTITVTDKKNDKQIVNVSILCSQAFSYTGASQTFTVPSGVAQITVDAIGGSGGVSNDIAPGLGQEVKATVSVTAGEVVNLFVGGAGAAYNLPGFNGGGQGSGGGGGASDIRIGGTDLSNRVIVAGGGGGDGISEAGGNGGYGSGSPGSDYTFCRDNFGGSVAKGGGGGSQVAPGAGGAGDTCHSGEGGADGALTGGVGGNGGMDQLRGTFVGGGGGGGYYGGGGGGSNAGGGGGSSFVESSVATYVSSNQAASTGNGSITISY